MTRRAEADLLLSTTFDLNPSKSKKAILGLEWHGAFFRPVMRLFSVKSANRYVTLDYYTWELLDQREDEIIDFFTSEEDEDDEDEPHDFFAYEEDEDQDESLDFFQNAAYSYEIIFNESFGGAKAVIINQQTSGNTSKKSTRFAMHAVTYFGFTGASIGIKMTMKELEKDSYFAYCVIDQILEFMKKEKSTCNGVILINNLDGYKAFKKYFTLKREEMYTSLQPTLKFFQFSFSFIANRPFSGPSLFFELVVAQGG